MNKEDLIQMLKEELNEYHPEFEYYERFGFERAIAMIEEIEEWTNENPEAHEYSICIMSLYLEPHPLQKLDNQAHALCREQLKELGFTIERRVIRSSTSYIISW